MSEQWKSPRKVEEEIKQYTSERFERYMKLEDDGVLTRALAIAALRDEMDSIIWTPDGVTVAAEQPPASCDIEQPLA